MKLSPINTTLTSTSAATSWATMTASSPFPPPAPGRAIASTTSIPTTATTSAATASTTGSSSDPISASDAAAAKRKKQSQSCDACRVRKVKCVEGDPPVTTGSTSAEGDQRGRVRCKHCLALGLECTYEYVPRKRGPPNLYLKRLQEAKASGLPNASDLPGSGPISNPSATTLSRRYTVPGGLAQQLGFDTPDLKSLPSSSVRRPKMAPKSASAREGRTGKKDKTFKSVQEEEEQQHRYYVDVEEANHERFGDDLGVGQGHGQGVDYEFDYADRSNTSFVRSHDAGHEEDGGIGVGVGVGVGVGLGPAELDEMIRRGPSATINSHSYAQSEHGNGIGMVPSSVGTSGSGDGYTDSMDAYGMPNLHHGDRGHHPHPHPNQNQNQHQALGNGSRSNFSHTNPNANTNTNTHTNVNQDPHLTVGHTDYPVPAPAPVPALALVPTSAPLPPPSGTSLSQSESTGSASVNHHLPRSAISPVQTGLVYFTSPSDAGSTEIAMPSISGRTYGAESAGSSNHMSNPMPSYDLTSETIGNVGASAQYSDNHTAAYGRLSSPLSNLLNPDRNTIPRSIHNHFHNPLDAILPRPLLILIINLFFDYIYPLTPCLHKPTFLQDLMSRREEQPGEEEWTALVLATVMSTLVQVPRAFVPLTRKEVRDLAARCHRETRKWSLNGYKEATVNTVIIRYFDTVYNYVRGEVITCHTSLCEGQALATVLRLHEEESYLFLNPIEREIRRRIFFLIFGADKSEATLSGRPIRMREEDCYSLRLPEEIDDDYITETRYLPQPAGVTSIITGFNAIIRLHCHLGRMMTKHREDKRDPPSGARLDQRLEEINRMLHDVMSVMANCPPALRLKSGLDSRVQSPAGGWDAEASAKLQEFFFDPTASREVAKDAFLVQQGNVYVNQQLARFVLLQYRNDLLTLKANAADEAHHGGKMEHFWNGDPPPAGYSQESGKDHVAVDKESLFYDLLTVLHSIPIQCIAVNGPSLVNAVRYVASALLDTVQGKTVQADSSSSGQTEMSASVLRAQGYLIDFLSILSEIEKKYQLDDDHPAGDM